MNSKLGFYILLSSIIIVIIGWSFFFFFPYKNIINEEIEKIYQIKDQIGRSAYANNDVDEIKNRLNLLKKELIKNENKILSQSDLDRVVKMLNKEMYKYGIKVINISPLVSQFLKLNQTEEFSILPIEVDLETKYINFGKFLDNIYNLPIYIHPESISINSINPQNNLLAIKFTISVYITS